MRKDDILLEFIKLFILGSWFIGFVLKITDIETHYAWALYIMMYVVANELAEHIIESLQKA